MDLEVIITVHLFAQISPTEAISHDTLHVSMVFRENIITNSKIYGM